MEAVPRLPMICFELKTSEEKANFRSKLKDYIQYHYNEDAESFSNQINQIESLRASACLPSRDVSGCSTLKRYYCQLHFLITRFPMGKGGDAAVKFTWKDPYSESVISGADVTIELASVLYNIGALHSQLGAVANRSNMEGMKMACTHFQCSAWAFQHIPEEFPQILSYDANADLLVYMNLVCLAQAQECILEKSMVDNRKATIIAKIAVQIVEYYKQALKKLTANANTDDPAISETISSKLKKKWESYLKFKISYYNCIGLLYQGQQSEDGRRMGERVAYYQAAFEKLEESRKLIKGLDNLDVVNEALQFTQDVVEGKRKAAKNENEFIFHEEVPNISTLPEMKGASLVKGIAFSVSDADVSGPDIFGRLIPLKAHETSSIYSEELAKLLRKTTADVLKAETELESFLSTLQLDELQARDRWELPQEVVDRCAALSAKPDAIQNLLQAINSLSDTYQDVEGMLAEIRSLLQKEEEDVLGYEDVVGKQPPSIAATDLTREAHKYQDAHAKASESNETLHKAMQLHVANLRLLSLPIRELKQQMPIIENNSGENNLAVDQMEALMNKVKEMKQQRGVLVAQLREAINRDDITQKVVTYTGESQGDLFRQELSKHQSHINLINQNIAAQDNILAAVKETYGRYSTTRRAISGQLQRRDAMVHSLIASYDAYEDLIHKSSKGLEFYKKLQGNVSKLLQRVKSTCKVQEEEREKILSNILEDVPRGTVRPVSGIANNRTSVPNIANVPSRIYNDIAAPPASGGLKLKDYLNIKKETGKMSLIGGTVPQPYDPPNQWVPGIRPAPVGSEENEPVLTKAADLDNRWDTENRNTYLYQQKFNNYQNPAQPPPPAYSPNYPQSTYNSYYQDPMATFPPAYTQTNTTQPTKVQNYVYPAATNPHYGPDVSAAEVPQAYNTNVYPAANQSQIPDAYSTAPAQYYSSEPYPSVASQSYSADPYATGVSQPFYTEAYSSVANQYYTTTAAIPTTSQYNYTVAPSTETEPSNGAYYPVAQNVSYDSYSYEPNAATLAATNYNAAYVQAVAPNPYNSQTDVYSSYIPQQVEMGYNQDSMYLQSGNTSLYTQTQQANAYTPTSSNVNFVPPKTLDLEGQTCQTPIRDGGFVQYPGGHSATQSPVTYNQAGFGNPSTTTTSSAGNAMPSASVLSSNVDLLAGLEFEVAQSPLLPQVQIKDSPVKTNTPVSTGKQEAVEDKVKEKKEPEEKRMDVEALRAFAPEVEKLEKFVEGLTLKTLNGPTALDLKWKEIVDAQEKDSHNRSISVARCYPMKNRVADILPFDHSRIQLPSTKDDYINASLIQPLTPGMVPLILTQAPLPVTFGDFWSMVVEQQVEVVVCLLADSELGGHIYWPEDRSQELTIGRIRLSLQSCNVRSHWVERIISVTADKITRIVVHLQFTAWPGSSFLPSPAAWLNFIQEVKTFLLQQRSSSHPAVVHCLSGVGRSGLFNLVLAAITDIESGRGIPDLTTLVARISQSRKNSLRDREHLKFAYQSVLYFCQDLLLKRGILTNRASFDDKKPNDGKCHTRHPSQDFLVPSETETVTSKIEALDIGDKKEESKDETDSNASNIQPSQAPPQSLLPAMDAKAFNLKTNDVKPARSKSKFTPESFVKTSSTLEAAATESSGDPLSSLDPLWSLKK